MQSESYTDDLYVIPVSKFVELAKHPAMKWDLSRSDFAEENSCSFGKGEDDYINNWLVLDAIEYSRNPDVAEMAIYDIRKAVENGDIRMHPDWEEHFGRIEEKMAAEALVLAAQEAAVLHESDFPENLQFYEYTKYFLSSEREAVREVRNQIKHFKAPSKVAKAYIAGALRGKEQLSKIDEDMTKNLPFFACKNLGEAITEGGKESLPNLQTALGKAFVNRVPAIFPDKLVLPSEDSYPVFLRNTERIFQQCQALRKALSQVTGNEKGQHGEDLERAFKSTSFGLDSDLVQSASQVTARLLDDLEAIRFSQGDKKCNEKIMDAFGRFYTDYKGGVPAFDTARADKYDFFASGCLQDSAAKILLEQSVERLVNAGIKPQDILKIAKNVARNTQKQRDEFLQELPF